MTVPGTPANKHDEILNEDENTTPLETISDNIDEFDTAILKERERTSKAKQAARYNRKKYADAVDIISEKEARIEELLDQIERKNGEIAKARKLDRYARDNQVVESNQQKNFSSWVEKRFLTGTTKK